LSNWTASFKSRDFISPSEKRTALLAMIDGLSRANVSTALGYSSIVAWLFAQAPQVIENYRNGSVEGQFVRDLTGSQGNSEHRLPFPRGSE
jgi:hypothetical protein